MSVYIPFVYFSFLFFIMYRKQKRFDVGSAITSVYILSSFFSILMYKLGIGDFQWNNFKVKFIPTFIYCFLLTLSILPFYSFNSQDIKIFKPINKKRFMQVSWILISLCLLKILLSFSDFINVLQSGDFLAIRGEYYESAGDIATERGAAIYDYLLAFAIPFSPILLGFFFYSVIYLNNTKLFNVLLFISSFAIVVVSILNASRTQVIYWILTFYLLYVFFRPHMNDNIKRTFNKILVLFGGLFLVYILAVTVSRFGEGSSANDSLIFYIGQPHSKFCLLWEKYTFDGFTWNRVFPMISKYILGEHTFNLTLFRESVSSRIGMEIGVFYTFLGDAMVDLGRWGMILYTIVFMIISFSLLKRRYRNTITISQFIYFIILARLPMLGVFAFVYLSIFTSFMIIASIIIGKYLEI